VIVSRLLVRTCVAVSWLAFGVLADAGDDSRLDLDVEDVINQAESINITRPAGETLEYIEAFEPILRNATPQQRARIDLIRARSHALLGDFSTGLALLDALLETDLLPEQRLRALELAANLAMNTGQFDAAFDLLNRGLAYQEQVDEPSLKTGVFGLAAYWHTQMGDREKGMEYARRTVSLARASEDVREICVALEKLGQAQEMVGLYDQAMATYESGLDACERAQDPVFTGVLHGLMGRLLHRMGRSTDAEVWLLSGIRKTREAGFEDGVTEAMTTYSRLLLDQQRIEQAHALLQDTLERIRPGERLQNYADLQFMLADIHRHYGDHDAAHAHLTEYLRAREEFLDAERSKQIAFMEVQFDALTREQEIQLLREQTRVAALRQEALRQQQRIHQLGYAVATFVLFILVFMLIRAIRERRHFRHLSAHDGLTGLLNHTSFIEAANQLALQAERTSSPLVLVLADIDFFKQFNDLHGHLAGDRVLRRVARCLHRIFSKHGPVGRIGGEEFAVCLKDASIARATELVGQLRLALQDCNLEGVDQGVSMSYGIGQRAAGESLDRLRVRTDRALYEAKNAGRNRLVVADADLTRDAPA
jgi:diguanylate cyclase (GGDEF)-like protein